MPIGFMPLLGGIMDDTDFILEDDGPRGGQNTTELTGWELVVFELADEEETGE
jgi:hypothetical protein